MNIEMNIEIPDELFNALRDKIKSKVLNHTPESLDAATRVLIKRVLRNQCESIAAQFVRAELGGGHETN